MEELKSLKVKKKVLEIYSEYFGVPVTNHLLSKFRLLNVNEKDNGVYIKHSDMTIEHRTHNEEMLLDVLTSSKPHFYKEYEKDCAYVLCVKFTHNSDIVIIKSIVTKQQLYYFHAIEFGKPIQMVVVENDLGDTFIYTSDPTVTEQQELVPVVRFTCMYKVHGKPYVFKISEDNMMAIILHDDVKYKIIR